MMFYVCFLINVIIIMLFNLKLRIKVAILVHTFVKFEFIFNRHMVIKSYSSLMLCSIIDNTC